MRQSHRSHKACRAVALAEAGPIGSPRRTLYQTRGRPMSIRPCPHGSEIPAPSS
jgi:hypothetical protein